MLVKIIDLGLCLSTSSFKEGRSVGINCVEALVDVLSKNDRNKEITFNLN